MVETMVTMSVRRATNILRLNAQTRAKAMTHHHSLQTSFMQLLRTACVVRIRSLQISWQIFNRMLPALPTVTSQHTNQVRTNT